jgi:CRISPR-associated Csx2 family protein
MKHTLVFTLGKGLRQKETSRYRTATYQFADGTVSRESAFFGFCLLEWLRVEKSIAPDLVVVLGTQGSIWDALLESAPDSLDEEALTLASHLGQTVAGGFTQTADLIDLSYWLSRIYKVPFELRIIPEGVDHEGQMQTLQTLAETVPPKSALHMCVTHGLRHMPMLQMLSAFHLAQTCEVTLAGLYYGALELGKNGRACPVIELSGAADLQKWNLALHTVSASGRLSALASAAEVEAPELAQKLYLADERLATNRVGGAAIPAREAATLINQQNLPGAGKLFSKAAIGRLTWATQSGLGAKQHLLAKQALANGDISRSVILCLEGFISKNLPQDTDETDYRLREETWKQMLETLHGTERRDFKTLEYLRNSIAHGTASENQAVKNLLSDRRELETFLARMLTKLAQTPTPH